MQTPEASPLQANPERQWLDAFANGQRELPLPVTLQLDLHARVVTFTIDRIFRLLPGKRVVLHSLLDGKRVVIKLFRKNTSSARHISNEKTGHARVSEAGVFCPPLLHEFVTPCGQFDGLIYGFIDDAPELSQQWPMLAPDKKTQWIGKLMQVMLALHRAGAWQSDIHAGNFLTRDGQLYLLDLGSIVTAPAPLARSKCIANLGQLIAQFDLQDRPLFETGIDLYCKLQQWDRQQLQPELDASISSAWNSRVDDYLAKARRECTLTVFTQSVTQVFACRRTWFGNDAQRFARDPNAFMAAGDILKAGNSATVVKTVFDGRPVVIKRYNIKSLSHALSRSLRPTRAEHSWHYSHLLEIAGMDSLKPVAWLEKRWGPLRSTAWFVCEWIDAPDLLSTGNARTLTSSECGALLQLLRSMRDCKLTHGDFKANNLLLKNAAEGNHCTIALIDLDAMRKHRHQHSFVRAFARDLARLAQNWDDTSAVSAQIRSVLQQLNAQ
jgi:serine/threonine-protein kinase RIO1